MNYLNIIFSAKYLSIIRLSIELSNFSSRYTFHNIKEGKSCFLYKKKGEQRNPYSRYTFFIVTVCSPYFQRFTIITFSTFIFFFFWFHKSDGKKHLVNSGGVRASNQKGHLSASIRATIYYPFLCWLLFSLNCAMHNVVHE